MGRERSTGVIQVYGLEFGVPKLTASLLGMRESIIQGLCKDYRPFFPTKSQQVVLNIGTAGSGVGIHGQSSSWVGGYNLGFRV